MDALTFKVTDHPTEQEIAAVEDGLEQYNRDYAEPHNYRPLSISLRDNKNEIVGGLVGSTHWGWLHVHLLWIDERVRRSGWGRRLLRAAEEEARARGCHHVELDTLDFQALPFYEKEGYTVWGVLEDYPTGHKRYYVKKELR